MNARHYIKVSLNLLLTSMHEPADDISSKNVISRQLDMMNLTVGTIWPKLQEVYSFKINSAGWRRKSLHGHISDDNMLGISYLMALEYNTKGIWNSMLHCIPTVSKFALMTIIMRSKSLQNLLFHVDFRNSIHMSLYEDNRSIGLKSTYVITGIYRAILSKFLIYDLQQRRCLQPTVFM